MSLINEVLRKLDQSPDTGGGPAPAQAHLRPAEGMDGHSLGRLVLPAVGLFLAGAAAGGMAWWAWWPAATPAGQESANVQGSANVREKAKESPMAKGSPAGGSASPDANSGPDASATKEQSGPPPLALEVPSLQEGRQKVQASPPEPVPEKPAPPPVKRPRGRPLKVAMATEGKHRPQEAEASQDPRQADTSPPAKSATNEASTGRVRVNVPDSWQRKQRAAELARSGYRALAAERYREAAERLGEAHQLVPERADIINNLALAQWQAGKPGNAVGTLTEGLQIHPGDSRMASNLGHFLLRSSEDVGQESGLQALTSALKKQGRLPLYALVGSLYRKMGRTQQAVAVYRSGIARKGAHWRLLVGLGLALAADGRGTKAAQVYQRARQRIPEGQSDLRKSIDARLEALPAAGDN